MQVVKRKIAVVALLGIIALACSYVGMPIIRIFESHKWFGYGGGGVQNIVKSVHLEPLAYLLIALIIGVVALLIELASRGGAASESDSDVPDRCPVCRSPLKERSR